MPSALLAPYYLLDLPTEGELVAHVTRLVEGVARLTLPRAPQGVEVALVRVYLRDSDQVDGKPYWDVATLRSRDALVSLAGMAVKTGQPLRIHKYGVAPAAYLAVELLPVTYAGPVGIVWPGAV